MPHSPHLPNNSARASFVSVALEVALTFCRLATDGDRRLSPIYLRKARKAYDIAVHYMFQLDMSAKEFNGITANAERVKLMLQSLEARNLAGSLLSVPSSVSGTTSSATTGLSEPMIRPSSPTPPSSQI